MFRIPTGVKESNIQLSKLKDAVPSGPAAANAWFPLWSSYCPRSLGMTRPMCFVIDSRQDSLDQKLHRFNALAPLAEMPRNAVIFTPDEIKEIKEPSRSTLWTFGIPISSVELDSRTQRKKDSGGSEGSEGLGRRAATQYWDFAASTGPLEKVIFFRR